MRPGYGNWGVGLRFCLAVACVELFYQFPAAAAVVTEVFAEPSIQLLSADSPRANAPGALRSRRLAFQPEFFRLLDAGVANSEIAFRFNLFSDTEFLVHFESFEHSGPSGVGRIYTGRVDGIEGSQVLLARSGNVMAGSLFIPQHGSFQISHDQEGRYEISELDPAHHPMCGVGIHAEPADSANANSRLTAGLAVPENAAAGKGSARLYSSSSGVPNSPSASSAGEPAGRTIELMVVYTTKARIGAGGTEAMQALIHLALAEANLAFQNSQTGVRIALVHTAEISYEESSDLELDLVRLASETDDFMNEVFELRDTHKADLVSLFVETSRGQMGFGYLRPLPRYGFTVLMRQYATSYDLLAHELGHNFGCDHDRQNGGGGGQHSYSYGHRIEADGQLYRTVMSYAPGLRIPYFSNPRVLFKGVATGVPEGEEGAADNARTITETARQIDNNRGIHIALVSPQPGAVLTEGDEVTFRAEVQSDEGAVILTEFFDGQTKIGETPPDSFSISWSGMAPGRHSLTAKVTIEGGLTATSTDSFVSVRPFNDDFARSILLSGSDLSAKTVLYAATGEPDEPAHFNSTIRSVWWKWSAPFAGTARVVATGGGRTPPRIAIYQGSELGSLTLIAKTDSPFAEVHFQPIPGEMYHFAMDGNAELVPAVFYLTMSPPPPNDDFVNATTVKTGTIRGTTLGATREPLEPAVGLQPAGHSIWFHWESTITGRAILTFTDSNSTLDLAVFTGTELSNLSLVATSAQAAAGFDVSAGTIYKFCVDGSYRSVSLNLSTMLPPANDSFAMRQLLSGNTAVMNGNNQAASREPDEPAHGSLPGGRSLWWRWRAPVDGGIRISIRYSPRVSPQMNVAVYTGDSLGALTLAGAHEFSTPYPDSFVLPVQRNVTYSIAVDSITTSREWNQLYLEFVPRPPNDDFTSRIEFSAPAFVTGTTFGATAETEEPAHGGKPAQHSVWWTWTFSPGGLIAAAIESAGAALPRVAVYKGDAGNLIPVARNVFGDMVGADLAFEAEDGQPYHFAVDEDVSSFNFTLLVGYEVRPENDDFLNSRPVVAGPGEIVGSNIGATREPGEPDHSNHGTGHSVWYTLRSRSTLPLRIVASGYDGWSSRSYLPSRVTVGGDAPMPAPVIAIYQGTTLETLNRVAGGVGNVTLNPLPNANYHIAVDGVSGHYGMFSMRLLDLPQNDDFTRAFRLSDPSSSSIVSLMSLRAATHEPDEPDPGNSIWWTWTPANSGIYTVTTDSSTLIGYRPPPTVLTVYAGSRFADLTKIGSSDSGTLTVPVTGQMRHYIALKLADDAVIPGSLLSRQLILRLGLQPTFLHPIKQKDGLVQFGVLGSFGQRFTLQSSPDMVTWTPLKDVVLQGSNEFRFLEPVYSGLAPLFYRVIPAQ